MPHGSALNASMARWLDPRSRALHLLAGERFVGLDLWTMALAGVCGECGAVLLPRGPVTCTGPLPPPDYMLNVGAYVEAGCRALSEP